MRRLVLLAVLASVAGVWYAALPPRAGALATAPADAAARGVIHVHTSRSDGTGTADEVAAAAARAGLDFVVFTDHGDATREPDPPVYRHGVLCIDAVEIGSGQGHIIALGLPAAPFPLGGEARDVVADVARLGGFAIAAHPGSARPELQWTDWSLPVSGVEWLNGDSEWRDEHIWTLARALLSYPARKTETLALLLDRPADVLARWDRLTQDRRIAAVAGSDAHARIGLRSLGEPYDRTAAFHVPAYEPTFGVFSNVLIGPPLSGDPAADAEQVIAALRDGRLYSRVDAVRRAGALTFTATDGRTQAASGDVLPAGQPVTVRAELREGPEEALIELLKNGAVVASGGGPRLEHVTDGGAGVYRVEVQMPGAPGDPKVPWMLSNPIYVGDYDGGGDRATERDAPSAVVVRYGDGPATDWTIETGAASLGAIDVVPTVRGTQLALRYALGGAESASPYVAFVMAAGDALARHDRLIFTAMADSPMRLSVQLREPAGARGVRWQRSVYLDGTAREITVRFDELRPAGEGAGEIPPDRISSVLFVVDTVHTPLGENGRIWLDDVKYGR